MKQFLLALLVSTSFLFSDPGTDDESASLALLVKTLRETGNETVRESILRGMLKGLEGRRQVQTPKGWTDLSSTLSQSSNAKVRTLSMELAQIFGDVKATDKALSILKDGNADSGSRRNALRSLLTQNNEEASELLESLLDDEELVLDAIRGYATMENATAPAVLLARYDQMDETHQRAIIETLATRKFYASSLLDAVSSNQISKDEIPVHVARPLEELLGERFSQVFGELKPIGDDREKLMAKYKALLTAEALAKADPAKGRRVYQKTCANCHKLYDEGGDIGPELTGSNRANLDYILLNSVDPSYDVPEGYRTVSVATEDGRLILGVVAEEDSTKLVLKTVEDPRLVISKDDIEARKVSDKSMMPEGQLDQMKSQEVIDLIRYLRTTEQVEVAK
jgi:putative heme-binding domain-containing protein